MTDTTNTETTTTAAPAEGMAEKLAAAGAKAKAAKAARTIKVVKGANLNPQFLELAAAAGAKVEEKSGFYKITTDVKGKAMYLARKGGRVDLSGFTVTDPSVVQVSEEEAQAKHLGKVRGQLNFELAGDGDAALVTAFSAGLTELAVPLPVVEKPKREPKPKAEKPAAAAPAESTPAAEQTPPPAETPAAPAAQA